jgi:hypothetical protein
MMPAWIFILVGMSAPVGCLLGMVVAMIYLHREGKR